MSDVNPDRPRDAVLYCERLLGLQSDCNIPYCPERESSTGWLLYNADAGRWYVGFRCPDHGKSGAWRPEWQPLIDEAIGIKTREGFDVAAALRALRDGHE
jgi:hypothetical protein